MDVPCKRNLTSSNEIKRRAVRAGVDVTTTMCEKCDALGALLSLILQERVKTFVQSWNSVL